MAQKGAWYGDSTQSMAAIEEAVRVINRAVHSIKNG